LSKAGFGFGGDLHATLRKAGRTSRSTGFFCCYFALLSAAESRGAFARDEGLTKAAPLFIAPVCQKFARLLNDYSAL
jgi:hypothetical protein